MSDSHVISREQLRIYENLYIYDVTITLRNNYDDENHYNIETEY
jgi:hypothetical protein